MREQDVLELRFESIADARQCAEHMEETTGSIWDVVSTDREDEYRVEQIDIGEIIGEEEVRAALESAVLAMQTYASAALGEANAKALSFREEVL